MAKHADQSSADSPTGTSTLDPASQEMFAPSTAVEAYMDQFVSHRPLPENLRQAIRYALLGGGKRLRPLLIVRSCEAVGGSIEQALPAAAAMEMIHTFSLVHDDLPAMDDDDLRRGRPTLHIHTNEAMAILAGDAMTSLAFELLSTRVHPPQIAAALMHELAVGTNDMIAGQVWDTLPDFSSDVLPLQRLQTIHRNKTGALIRASCRMGAIAGGGSPGQVDALTRHGDAIGLMFQIMDDVLDVTQTAEAMGKRTGKDEDKGKLTYPLVLGLEKSRAEIQRLRHEAHEALTDLGTAGKPLADLCDFMAVRQK
jgi:geranylgeranyl diphosphate synthase, type II